MVMSTDYEAPRYVFFSTPLYLVQIRPEYLLQQSVLESLQCDRPSFTPRPKKHTKVLTNVTNRIIKFLADLFRLEQHSFSPLTYYHCIHCFVPKTSGLSASLRSINQTAIIRLIFFQIDSVLSTNSRKEESPQLMSLYFTEQKKTKFLGRFICPRYLAFAIKSYP
jgi:hypothetical protein